MAIKYIYTILIIVLLFSCGQELEIKQEFTSDFYSPEAQTWIGPAYWSNPMQDWQINDDRLICLVSKQNRNVHLLSHKLDTLTESVKITVDLKVLNPAEGPGNNWVGFSLGSKGEFNDYRDDAIFGKGLNIGLSSGGELFIGEQRFSEDKRTILDQLKDELSLEVLLTPEHGGYKIRLSLFSKQSAKLISQVSMNNVPVADLLGDVVLVSNFNIEKGGPAQELPSVSFKNWHISGENISYHNGHSFGPIMFSQYTLSRGVMKLTAQMAPVANTYEKVRFQVMKDGSWQTVSSVKMDIDARTATFRLADWPVEQNIKYRLAYTYQITKNLKKDFYWHGTIRQEPSGKDEIVVAGFTGNDHLGFPNTDIFRQVKFHDPDVLFFSGDQIYEPNGGYGAQRTPMDKSILDYLRKWYMYGWAYRDLLKDRPTISITDDHDVYHGNIWGAGGRPTPASFGQGSKAQDAGGYKMPARWVKMVERTQTSHLPDPFDPTPVAQGIGTYYTDMVYGGISFAIIEDRKFKSAPMEMLPEAEIVNGWPQNKKFNMAKDGDIDGAKLLGDRQVAFLNKWVSDWSYQAEMKVLLSQTIFANVATLPREAMSGAIIPTLRIMHEGDYPKDDKPVTDLDSNGWPQSGRNKAVSIIRKGFAFHLAGDQHLGSTIQYGLEEWNDSGFAFCVPSISNHWPRRWYPAEGGDNRDPDKPKYTGENRDGFGNKITVHAASNPLFTGLEPARLYDRAAGFGIVRLNKVKRELVIECWPRQTNPELGDSEQYPGWPITITQEANYGRAATSHLPEIIVYGLDKPVLEIINEETGELVYSLRLNSSSYRPKIFNSNVSYTIKVGEPDQENWQVVKGITPDTSSIEFQFN